MLPPTIKVQNAHPCLGVCLARGRIFVASDGNGNIGEASLTRLGRSSQNQQLQTIPGFEAEVAIHKVVTNLGCRGIEYHDALLLELGENELTLAQQI